MDKNKAANTDKVIILSSAEDRGSICKILDVKEIAESRVITDEHVLALDDATIYPSQNGIVYAYNVSLPYLSETAHLADVEKNIIVSQAFNYPNRADEDEKKPRSGVAIVAMILVFIILLVAMFT